MGKTTTLPTDSEERKGVPLYSGVLKYFPAALAGVAMVSKWGNDKHNPGEELHHSRAKSGDEADCIMRHLIDLAENGGYDEHSIPQVAYIAWRALALAQKWYEEHEHAPLAPGAKEPKKAWAWTDEAKGGYGEALIEEYIKRSGEKLGGCLDYSDDGVQTKSVAGPLGIRFDPDDTII